MIIYKITNKINNKVYIGQTVNSLKERRRLHENGHKYKNTKNYPICKAIKKYGKENFDWEIIDRANSLEELNLKEEYWITIYDCIIDNGKGYNVKFGGNNHKHIETTKKKISEAQLGPKNHAFGKKGELSESSKKLIDIYSGEIYVSATECSEKTGLQISKICSVCRGDRGSTGGRVFRYLDDNNNPITPENSKLVHRRHILNVYTGEVFKTGHLAAKSKGLKSGTYLYKQLKNEGICYLWDTVWCYVGTSQSIIDNFIVNPIKNKNTSTYKKVLNRTTGIIYESISDASKSVNGSKSSLAQGFQRNGKIYFYKGNEWELIG